MKKWLKYSLYGIIGFIVLMFVISLFIPESYKKEQARKRFLKDSIEQHEKMLAIKKYNDSVAESAKLAQLEQKRLDSIALAEIAFIKAQEEKKRDSINKAEAIKAQQLEKERKLAESKEPEYETYNGHRVFTGPRGGKYYMSGSTKVYIKR